MKTTLKAGLILTFGLLAVLTSVRAEDSAEEKPLRVYRDRVEPHWFADATGATNRFWYRVATGSNQCEFVMVDAVKGVEAPAFDHARLARALTKETGETMEATRLPFTVLEFSPDSHSVELRATNMSWKLDLDSYGLTRTTKTAPPFSRSRRHRETPPPEPSPEKIPSPDGKWEVSLHGGNLVLRELKSGTEDQLTDDANPDLNFAQNNDADQAIEMNYDTAGPEHPVPEIYWSPDSSYFVAMKWKRGTQRKVYEVRSSPDDQLQPKLVSFPYLKPGDEVPYAKPHLFSVATKKEIAVDDALFPNPWSIDSVRWSLDSSRFTFLYNQRGHQVLRILGVEVATGAVKPVVDEQSKTFICYSGKFFAEYVDDKNEIIWMSERDGWNHLYLYDAKTGEVKNQITKGEWPVLGVDWVDQDKRQIWFRAGGLNPAQDPYYVHYCRINFDGSGMTDLTDGNGTHAVEFSPDHQFFVDTWSRVDMPPEADLRKAEDGKLICQLERADATELNAAGWQPPQQFVAKGRDGVTDIYGVVLTPRHFDAGKKYPVLEEIYAGPQDSFVPKKFYPDGQSYMQKLADKGFVVVQCDGMGTSNRSKKFHDVCWKNLADSGFADHILWIKAAAVKYPWMDLTRMGIFGTSAGAQSALRGLLDHGDFYQAGMADSGCHDNRMDKIWWNEQWMGWPVDDSYIRCSNVVDAHKLQGKLLLMVGEMDNNVDPSSTMQVVDALIKAGKDFELLVMPGAGHGVAYTPYGQKRLAEFFTRTFKETN
jgi:dipeptidyl aminopeptidase/acylaminoacyl peptidase